MKALVYTSKKNLDFKDYYDPIQKEGEEIIEIKSVGICGSDMHAFLGHDERRPAPLISVSYTHLTLPTNREV